MKKRIFIKALVMLLSVTVLLGTQPIEMQAANSVSFNGIWGKNGTENEQEQAYGGGMQMPVVMSGESDDLQMAEKEISEESMTNVPDNVAEPVSSEETYLEEADSQETAEEAQPEYPLESGTDLFELDWQEADDDEINHCLGMTEWNVIGMWLSSMEEDELALLLERDTVLVQETTIIEPDAEPVQMLYYEYAMKQYSAMMMSRAVYPSKASGYWMVNVVQTNAAGTPVRTAVITFKVSGVDTSVATTERQSITLAKSVTGNWCDISWGDAEENYKTFRTDEESTVYPNARANFSFVKPAGYKVNVSYNLTSSFYKLYWSKKLTFGAGAMFSDNGTISAERFVYPGDATYNGVSASEFTASNYTGRHYLCSIVNMYVNAGIGTTSAATKGNLVQTITLSPVNYNVSYDGNGATSGSVAAQNCSYDVSYIAQPNGFLREYTVTYDGNGGTPSVSSRKAAYTFKGWGLNQKTTASYAAGDTYKNLTGVSGGLATMYALWNPVSIKLATASRSGYSFSGWNIGSAGADYTPTTDVTAIAKWTPNTYTIRFQSSGGSECADISATYDKSVILPTPIRDGYVFNGWKGATGTYVGSVRNLSAENGATVTLVADWSAVTDTPYTVRCYKQPALKVTDKEKYVLFDLKNGDPIDGEYVQYGTTDTTVSVSAQNIEGYMTPSAQSVKIAGDGSSVVCFYYDIKTNSVTAPTLSASDKQLDEIAKKIAAGLSFSLDVDGVEYEIAQTEDGTLGIRFISTDAEKIAIPDVVKIGEKVYRITEIQAGAFRGNVTVKEVQLSANISRIGNAAFEGCTSLSKVVLHKGLVTIGNKAFFGCTSLKSIKLPSTVQSIGNSAFQNCAALSRVTLNGGLLKIGKKAFYSCPLLTKISIPKTVLQIGAYAFAKCSKLRNVTFVSGSRLLSVGTGVFSNCVSLKKIKLPSKLTAIPTKAFYCCKKLGSATIGAAVTQIGASAFSGCAKLTKITIPSKVQTIGKKAFYQCKSLKKVTVKTKALTSVGSKAFKQCRKGILFSVPKEKKDEYSRLFRGKY